MPYNISKYIFSLCIGVKSMKNDKIIKITDIVCVCIYALIGMPLILQHYVIPSNLTILLFITSEVFFLASAVLSLTGLIKSIALTKKRKTIYITFFSYLVAYAIFMSIDLFFNLGISIVAKDIVILVSTALFIIFIILISYDREKSVANSHKTKQ